MAMNDEETIALIAGGHTFGKTRCRAGRRRPRAGGRTDRADGPRLEVHLKPGWEGRPSGLEVTWTYHPTRWDNEFFHILFAYDWESAVAGRGEAVAAEARRRLWTWCPAPSREHTEREPRMLTSDIALRVDPVYEKIARRFLEHPDEFQLAFAKAWYKLLHRDMGPVSRYLGPWVPEAQPWQDPVPAVDHELVSTTTWPP